MTDTICVVSDVDFRSDMHMHSIAETVGPILAQTYPGYRWRVEPNVAGGIVDVRCEMTDARYGFTLIPEHYFSETQWRAAIIKAGGEILERAAMSRRKFNEVDWLTRPRDFAGRIVMDVT